MNALTQNTVPLNTPVMKNNGQGIIKPPRRPKNPPIKPLSGMIVIVRIDDDDITILPTMAKIEKKNIFALNFDTTYYIDLDEKRVEVGRKFVKPYALRGDRGFFKKMFGKPIKTSAHIIAVNIQLHKSLSNVMFVTFKRNLQSAKAVPRQLDIAEIYNELRTSNNRRAVFKGGVSFGPKMNMLRKKAASFGQKLNDNRKKAQQWAKEKGVAIRNSFAAPQTGPSRQPMIPNQMQQQRPLQPHEIQALYNQQGGMPDFVGDAKKLAKFAMSLPANGFKAIQNKAKDLYKEIKGGNYKKAEKCCKQLEKMCKDKCKKQKGGAKGKKDFDIHSKVNQEFAKELQKRFNKKADKLKDDIKKIQKLKGELKKLPAKDFDNKLKSKKNMSNSDKKKHMINRQDKKIAAKKQAIKEHEQKIYGPLRCACKGKCKCKNKYGGWKNPLKERRDRKKFEKAEKERKVKKAKGLPIFEKLKALRADDNYGWKLNEGNYWKYGEWNYAELNKDIKIVKDRLARGPKLFSQLVAYYPQTRRRLYRSTETPGFWDIEKMEEDLNNEKLFVKLQSLNPKVNRAHYYSQHKGWDIIILEYDLGIPLSSLGSKMFKKLKELDNTIDKRDYEYRESGYIFLDTEEVEADLMVMLGRKKEGNKLFAELEKLLLEKLGEKPVLNEYGVNKKRANYFIEFRKQQVDKGAIYHTFEWNFEKLKNRIKQLKQLKKPLMQRSQSLIG